MSRTMSAAMMRWRIGAKLFQAVLVGRGFVEKLLHEQQVQIALRLLTQPVGDFGSVSTSWRR